MMKRISLFIFGLIVAVGGAACIFQKSSPGRGGGNIGQIVIPTEYTEDFDGPKPGFRFKIRNVDIEGQGRICTLKNGGTVHVEMEVLHDCRSCGNAVNQVIVGLDGQEKAQVSVWNGKKRSGGPVKVINPGHPKYQCYGEDNEGEARWVRVFYDLEIPRQPGLYLVRVRYAQGHTGNLRTREGLARSQKIYGEPLNWWKTDRPGGPGGSSNIGAVIIK